MNSRLRTIPSRLRSSSNKTFLFLFLLLLNKGSLGQVDPHKLDSLEAVIERREKEIRNWQDSFQRKQDSLIRIRTKAAAKEDKIPSGGIPRFFWVLAIVIVLLLLVKRLRRS